MEMACFLRTAVSVIALALGLFTTGSADPQVMILAQSTIEDVNCVGTTSEGVPTWYVRGGIVQGDYQEVESLKEFLNVELMQVNSGPLWTTITLSINGSVENNHGTTFKCVTDMGGFVITVMVQGVLSAPSLVEPITNSTTISLRWDPPFTLDIPGDDILGYTVYCRNLGTGLTEAFNVNETKFNFTGMQGEVSDPCHEYEFRVSARNIVGQSVNSTVLSTCFGEVPQPVNVVEETLSGFVNFIVTIVDTSCHGRLPESIVVTVTVDGRVMPDYYKSFENKSGELNFQIQNLPTGNFCNASIRARNQIGTSDATDIIFDCQLPDSGSSGTDDPENTPQTETELIIPVAVGVCAAAGCVVILTAVLLFIVKCSRERDQVDAADLEKPAEDNLYTDVPTKEKVPHDHTTTAPEIPTQERQSSTTSADSQTPPTQERQPSTSSADSQTPLLTDSPDQETRERQLLYADLQQMQQPKCQPPPPLSQAAGVEYAQILQQRTDGDPE